MVERSGTGVVWWFSTVALGLILAACTLSAGVSTTTRPDPRPGQAAAPTPVRTAAPAARVTGPGLLACGSPACTAGCGTALATAIRPLDDLVRRSPAMTRGPTPSRVLV